MDDLREKGPGMRLKRRKRLRDCAVSGVQASRREGQYTLVQVTRRWLQSAADAMARAADLPLMEDAPAEKEELLEAHKGALDFLAGKDEHKLQGGLRPLSRRHVRAQQADEFAIRVDDGAAAFATLEAAGYSVSRMQDILVVPAEEVDYAVALLLGEGHNVQGFERSAGYDPGDVETLACSVCGRPAKPDPEAAAKGEVVTECVDGHRVKQDAASAEDGGMAGQTDMSEEPGKERKKDTTALLRHLSGRGARAAGRDTV